MTPEARMADVANALAEWINKTPLAPNEIHAVYAAHVLLCSLIEGESALRGEVAKLQQQRLDDHRAWHELNERRAEAEAALADLRHQLQEWLAANAPGGWIDGLRKSVGERDTLLQPWRPIESAPIDRLVLMWTPKENLYLTDTIDEMPEFALDDMRVSSRRHWTWATHWMPLPAPPCGVATLTPPMEQP